LDFTDSSTLPKTKGRNTLFYATNIAPLWVQAYDDPSVVDKIMNYLDSFRILDYPGGIPSSLHQSGEQWDYPNGWAPNNHIVVEALQKTENARAREAAFSIAQKWVQTTFLAYQQTENMFEKVS